MDRFSPEFKRLQQKWYKKLEKDGFKDIEQENGLLKEWASSYYVSKYNAIVFAAKQEYYQLAGKFLHTHDFKNALERKIWSLHSTGLSVRKIILELKKRYKRPIYINLVHRIIKTLAKQMLEEAKSG